MSEYLNIQFNKKSLERLYRDLNKHEYVEPDPLQFVYEYDTPADREVVGLVASSLAYGRVAQILKSVSTALKPMGNSPSDFVQTVSFIKLRKTYSGFKHRFTTGNDLSSLLNGAGAAIKRHGSLRQCFSSYINVEDETFIPALGCFVDEISGGGGDACFLTPSPAQGSACKRMNLFLRWMVRHDSVDPGCWAGLPASKLVVPLDTHMFGIGKYFELTSRKQADLKAAVEITRAFGRICPEDPVKYDFALTRFGIWENARTSMNKAPKNQRQI